MEKAKKDWLVVAGMSLIVVLFWGFWRWSEPGFFLSDDNGNYFLGTYLYTYRSVVKEHTLPLVNYHQYLGNVHLGQGQSAVFYPLLYVAFFVSDLIWKTPMWGVDVLVLVHWWLAVIGMWLLLKQLKVRNDLAILGSLLYLSFPFVVGVSRIWIVIPYWLAYLPWNFWLLQKFLEQHGKEQEKTKKARGINRIVSGLIVVKLMLVLQGYIQWVVTSLFLELVYLVIGLWQKEKRVVKWQKQKWLAAYALVWMLVAMLGAPVLLPLYQSAGRSLVRSGQLTFEDFMRVKVAAGDFLAAQLMQFRKGVIFDGTTFVYYVGLVLVVAWIFLAIKNKSWKSDEKKSWWQWNVMAFFSLACASSLYSVAFYVPVLNWFRWPFKYFLPFEFFLTVCLTLGLNNWQSKKSRLVGMTVLAVGIVSNFTVMYQNKGIESSFSRDRIKPPIEKSWENVIDANRGRTIAYGIDFDGSEDQVQLGTYNFATVGGYSSFLGYDATIAKSLWETVRGVAEFGVNKEEINEETIKYLKGWGLKYWVSDNLKAITKMRSRNPQFRKIYDQNGLVVLEDEAALPLVYWQNGSEANFEFRPNGIDVDTQGKSGELTFNIFGWPEYQVFGDRITLVRSARDNRIIVNVASGINHVRLRYIDRQLQMGLLIWGLTMSGLAIYLGIKGKFGGVFGKIRGRG